jgi:hypothetical protein
MAGHRARDPGRRQPVKTRQREIGQNQVNAPALQRRHESVSGLHADYLALDASGIQRGLNQFSIGGIILQMQNMEWGFHGKPFRFRKKRIGDPGIWPAMSDVLLTDSFANL